MPKFIQISEDAVRRSANILGPSSASAKALQDFEGRKARGETPVFVQIDNTLYVVDLDAEINSPSSAEG